MRRSAVQQPDLFPKQKDLLDFWSNRLMGAFSNSKQHSGFLSIAEDAVKNCPGDAQILLLAATAALFDHRPDRALVFLKQFSKIATSKAQHLLHALALGQLEKYVEAKALLDQHKLTNWMNVARVFPAAPWRQAWVIHNYDAILAGAAVYNKPQQVTKSSPKQSTKQQAKTPPPSASKGKVKAPAAAPTPPAPSLPPGLPLVDIDIPFTVEFNAAPLISALSQVTSSHRATEDGGWFGLRERFAHLGLAQGFDELLCVPHLKGVEPFLHQVETVRKVLKQFRGRVLLADEVGLGKTIEAGMVLKEYALRGMAEQTLVLTPASLVGQWREELETKFGLAFATTNDPGLRDEPEAFWGRARIIASIATARRREHAECLVKRQFDLIIVDEAHHLRDRTSQSWKLVDSLNKRFLLLLSATPVQNDLIELYNLLTLLKPGIFKTLKEFRQAYMTPGKPRQPANSEQLRTLMRGAMIRNTRAVVALKLPRRNATTIKVDGSPHEVAAYADLAAAARKLAADGGARRERLALHHLLGAAGSSPQAAARSVARVAERHRDDPVWAELADRWSAIGTSAKELALLDLIGRNPQEKKIVFVHARETLAHVAERLELAGVSFTRFDGSMSGPEKDASIAAFRDHANVLLCTQSGGEGRNIQFCNTLINFDLPWNPMAIEQRIGRIDRIGQTREVFVFNLVTRGTFEEQLLALLDDKISMFELVVGEVGAILGGLEEEREFPDLVLDAWLTTTESGRVEAFEALGQRLVQARDAHEGAKELDEKLFGQDFEAA